MKSWSELAFLLKERQFHCQISRCSWALRVVLAIADVHAAAVAVVGVADVTRIVYAPVSLDACVVVLVVNPLARAKLNLAYSSFKVFTA